MKCIFRSLRTSVCGRNVAYDMEKASEPSKCQICRLLFLGVWRLGDACEPLWWLETSESAHADILKLHVVSWECLEDLLEALGTTLGGPKLISDMSWGLILYAKMGILLRTSFKN